MSNDNDSDDVDLDATNTRYKQGLYADNPNKDYIREKDLIPDGADLNAGLGDDAYDNYDSDDATLTADNDSDVTQTGMDESDADNLQRKEKIGDTVIN